VSGPRTLVWAAAVLALAGCDGGVGRACPAIAWGNGLTVELAGDWPPGEGRSVRVGCPRPCGLEVPDGVAPLDGDRATVSFLIETPDAVDVAVLGPDGAVLTETRADPEWVRVGGSAECGGPHEATGTVPAP
jgi:hypothetical protein